jgi:hypothetical protein
VARSAEIAVVYGGGLAQGLALVSFPAAATILTAADGYGLSSNQYGSIFLPLFAGSVLASLLAPTLARRRSLKRVLLTGFGHVGTPAGPTSPAQSLFRLTRSAQTPCTRPVQTAGRVLVMPVLVGLHHRGCATMRPSSWRPDACHRQGPLLAADRPALGECADAARNHPPHLRTHRHLVQKLPEAAQVCGVGRVEHRRYDRRCARSPAVGAMERPLR